jgi:hypothetical protein
MGAGNVAAAEKAAAAKTAALAGDAATATSTGATPTGKGPASTGEGPAPPEKGPAPEASLPTPQLDGSIHAPSLSPVASLNKAPRQLTQPPPAVAPPTAVSPALLSDSPDAATFLANLAKLQARAVQLKGIKSKSAG